MSISIIGDYRLAFIKPGQVTGHDVVKIDFTPTPSPFSPWPKQVVGKITESVADKHLKHCGLMNGCGKLYHDKDGGLEDCIKTGAHDCRCPACFKYLRSELKKNK